MKNLIIIPYASIDGFQTGQQMVKVKNHNDIYWKNVCVAAASCKHYNSDCDIAVVTNITPPQQFADILNVNEIQILVFPFDRFNFGAEYTWSLAFYKLCALSHVVESTDYDSYCYLDSDVYVQGSLAGAFAESKWYIMMPFLYQKHPGVGLTDRTNDMIRLGYLNEDTSSVMGMGGEFFIASKTNAELYLQKCHEIFEAMYNRQYVVNSGDEFISSLALHLISDKVRMAQAYVGRYYTRTFRLIPERWRYHPVPVLHVPGEKSHGMLKLFSHYISKGKMPSKEAVYRILHISHPSLMVRLHRLYFFTMIRLGRKSNPWE